MKLYFVRHGQSLANEKGIIADGFSPLTLLGFKQADETAVSFEDKTFDMVLVSPFTRAVETANRILSKMGKNCPNIVINQDLKERYLGTLEGKPKEHESSWYFSNEPDIFGAESLADLFARMNHFVTSLTNDYPQVNSALVVGHSISGAMLQLVAKGISDPHQILSFSELANAQAVEINL